MVADGLLLDVMIADDIDGGNGDVDNNDDDDDNDVNNVGVDADEHDNMDWLALAMGMATYDDRNAAASIMVVAFDPSDIRYDESLTERMWLILLFIDGDIDDDDDNNNDDDAADNDDVDVADDGT